MDLLVLILILLSGYIIKYLIDTINSLNNEIREIKMKCISNDAKIKKNVKFATLSIKNVTDNINDSLIKNIVYFKDYFDKNKDIYDSMESMESTK
jgi:predicted PurR-regulated permease PerM